MTACIGLMIVACNVTTKQSSDGCLRTPFRLLRRFVFVLPCVCLEFWGPLRLHITCFCLKPTNTVANHRPLHATVATTGTPQVLLKGFSFNCVK